MKWPLFTEWRKQRQLTAELADDAGEIGVVQGGRSYRMSFNDLRAFFGVLPTVLVDVVRYSTMALTDLQQRTTRANIRAMQDLRVGRTLTANGVVGAADYGTVVSLAGFRLDPSVNQVGGVLGVQGAGSVVTNGFGTVVLRSQESAILSCLAANDLRVLSVLRKDASIFTASDTPPSSPLVNDEWLETSTGSSFVYFDGYWIERIGRSEFPNSSIRVVTVTTGTIVNSDVNNYVRFTAAGAKTCNVPLTGVDFTPPSGSVVTIRNASSSGSLTLSPFPLSGGPTLNAAAGELIIPPATTAQIMYQGANVWDVL